MLGASIAALGFLASYFVSHVWVYYITIGAIGGTLRVDQ